MNITLTPRSADYEVKPTQDHESFRHTIRDFAEKEIRPVAFEIDKKNKIPRELLDRIAKLGVPAITYKEEYGGLGRDKTTIVIPVEQIPRRFQHTSSLSLPKHPPSGPPSKLGDQQPKKPFLSPI